MEGIKKLYNAAQSNLDLVGWVGLFVYPVYYFAWQAIFPGDYDNLPLRIVCSILCVLLLLRDKCPKPLQRYLHIYFFIIATVCLPFFHGFMMIMNNWSSYWAVSFMVTAFMQVILLQRIRYIVLQLLIAVPCVYLAVFWEVGYQPIQYVDWGYVVNFAFIYVVVGTFFYRNQTDHESKVSIAKSFGAGIAHEMRNPMSTLKTTVDVLRDVVPNNARQDVVISAEDVEKYHMVLDSADNVIRSANEAIDLLLTSIDENRIATNTFDYYDVLDVVKDALASFPYKEESDRQRIQLDVDQRFRFYGSATLLKYCLYNLLKNAFYYNTNDEFAIRMQIIQEDGVYKIRVRDTGVGIEEGLIDTIFQDFSSFGKEGGNGLGLPFCRKVMEAFGGRIDCQSVVGQWTEFTLSFMNIAETEASDNYEMLNKKVLYIGETSAISGKILQWAQDKNYSMSRMQLYRASKLADSDYDIIIIDVSSALMQKPLFTKYLDSIYSKTLNINLLFWNEEQLEKISPYQPHAKFISVEDISRYGAGILIAQQDAALINEEKNLLRTDKKLLVVDDNHSLRAMTAIMLGNLGYQIDQAKDGEEAYQMVTQTPYALILLDVEMPRMNGIEFTEKVRCSHGPEVNVVIIAYTGDNSPQNLAHLKQVGVNDYVTKPADKTKLVAMINKWL